MEKITMTDSTIAFIGLGLIGGSIARAIRKTRPDIRIMAYMRSRSRLEQARQEGIVEAGRPDYRRGKHKMRHP